MMQADAFSLQPLSRILTFNGFGATTVDCLNESARTRKIKKHYFFKVVFTEFTSVVKLRAVCTLT